MVTATPFNQHAIRETFLLRASLEAFAAARLAHGVNRDTTLQHLRLHLDVMKAAAMQSHLEQFYDADYHFHRTLIEGAQIPSLLASWELVWKDLSAWIPLIANHYHPSLMFLYRAHEYLFQAWISGDNAAAEQATYHHGISSWERIVMSVGDNVGEANDLSAVDRATNFICIHFASEIEVEWLAQNVSFVSASHLTRCFREKLRISPHAYLRRFRLEKSMELLNASTEPIYQLARKVGYKNVSHYVKDFRLVYDITPKQYRLKQKSKA